MENGTASLTLTQFTEILNPISKGTAVAARHFLIKELLDAIRNQDDAMARQIILMFAGMITGDKSLLSLWSSNFPIWLTIDPATSLPVSSNHWSKAGASSDAVYTYRKATEAGPLDGQIVEFVKVKVGDLGFSKAPTTGILWAVIQAIGELCWVNDALYIRLRFKDQPKGSVVSVVTKPVIYGGDLRPELRVFNLYGAGVGKGGIIDIMDVNQMRWSLSSEIVYRGRKKG